MKSILGVLALSCLVASTSEVEAQPGLGLMEAIELTLARDPAIDLVASQLEAAQGGLLGARGQFDPVFSTSLTRTEGELPGAGGGAEEISTLESVTGVTTLLRSGLSLEPEVSLLRTGDADPAVNQATVSFTLRQPLLEGRGRQVVTSAERAARREVAAARLDLEHAVALRLRAMISQYWSVRAALLDLEVLQTTEESSRRLLETTRRLIAADVTPAAEIVQLEADLASREASRIAGEQALFAARRDLGREIGLEPAESAVLPLPADPLPMAGPAAGPEIVDEAALQRLAQARRADLLAAGDRLEAARALLAAAENALRPALDLVLTPSYSGRVEDDGAGAFFRPLLHDVPGLTTSVGFALSWPTLNRRDQGLFLQVRAAVDQSALLREILAREIGAEVAIALDAVRRSGQRLERALLAVRAFEQTVENEEKKLRAGSSTLIDVITQRDRLTAARQRVVAAQLDVALALLELRFQTGTLVIGTAGDAEPWSVRYADVTTLPLEELTP